MGTEIERKFLVNHSKWNTVIKPSKQLFRQGYLSVDPNKTIRVRLTDKKAYLTIKGITKGISRPEFEYEIPGDEAEQLLDRFAESEIKKWRYLISYKSKTWEVDEFLGENQGLIIAEIELKSESEPFELPDWIEKEVTGEEKYYNAKLSVTPFKFW